MATDPIHGNLDDLADDYDFNMAAIAEAMADPDFRASLEEETARAERGELEEGITTDELLRRLNER